MISVIIPVYNGEKWMHRCLDSLLAQTVFDDMEIIIVDDGSSDSSGAIADEYAAAHENINCLHIANGGVSHARNTGIDAAKGEFIAFADIDDYMEPDFYERLLCGMTEEHDLVCGGYIVEYDDRTVTRKSKTDYSLSGDAAMEAFIYAHDLDPNIWDKLFRRSVIGDDRFSTSLIVGEDKYFLFGFIKKVRSIRFIPEAGYHYIINSESVMNAAFSEKKMRSALLVESLINSELHKEYPQFGDLADCLCIDTKCRVYGDIYRSGRKKEFAAEYKTLRSDIRRFPLMKKIKHSSAKHAFALLLAKISPALYVFFKYGLKLQHKS